MIKLLAIAAVSLILAACGQPYNTPPPPPSAFTANAIYCYRTLARNDCYAEAQPGEEYRYVGGYPVPPK